MIQVQTETPTIQVLEANYQADTTAVQRDSPAYLLAVAERPSGTQFRVRLYARARDGRYISIWQRRDVVGKFRPVHVSPRNPLYPFLLANGDVHGIARAASERGEI